MRGKVSRVILVCTVLIALSHAWWPFEKSDDKPNKRGRKGRRDRDQDDEEPDRVEQEWEVDDNVRYEPEKGRGASRDSSKERREK